MNDELRNLSKVSKSKSLSSTESMKEQGRRYTESRSSKSKVGGTKTYETKVSKTNKTLESGSDSKELKNSESKNSNKKSVTSVVDDKKSTTKRIAERKGKDMEGSEIEIPSFLRYYQSPEGKNYAELTDAEKRSADSKRRKRLVVNHTKGVLGMLWKIFSFIVLLPYRLLKFCTRFSYVILNTLLLILIVGVVGGTFLSAKFLPMYEESCNDAYTKLSGLKDSNFHMLENTRIYDKDGAKIGEIDAGDYLYTDITNVSQWVQYGYIAAEDKRFREHLGIDMQGITRAALSLVKHNGEVTQGGSTITQQVVKNCVLTQEVSYSRKLMEVLIAPRVEQRYSKDKIMEFYVNTCYYGNRCYGIQTASRYYFGKDCSKLTIAESAMLCGVSNSPNNYNPVASMDLANKRKVYVLDRMLDCGFITKEQYDKAMKQNIKLKIPDEKTSNENYMVSYAIHCLTIELMKKDGFVFEYNFDDKKAEESYNERYSEAYKVKSALIRGGGYEIHTSFDKTLQKKLQKAIDNDLKSYKEKNKKTKKYALQGASVCIDNQTGYIVAMVGGRGTKDEFNRAFLSNRQPGSTIKPLLVYAPAINEGVVNPSTIINDHEVWDKTHTYSPKNSGGGYRGDLTIREGLARSLNTVAFQVFNRTGSSKSINYLEEMKFTSLSYADNTAVALSLGGFTYGCKVIEMAKGYNTLAMNGQYSSRTCLVTVVHQNDGVVYAQEELSKTQTQVFTSDTAFMMTDALQGGIEESYGTGKSIKNPDMIIAGKTGTTSSNKDAWFCGYTKYYTTAVWVGYDTPRVMDGMYGGTVPAKIFSDYMKGIPKNMSKADFTIPSTCVLKKVSSDGTYGGSEKKVTNKDGRSYKLRKKGWEWYSVQNQETYKTFQKDYKLEQELSNAKSAVSEFKSFFLNSVEDCNSLETNYRKCLSVINEVSDEYEQESFKKQATDHYNKLSGEILEKWQDAIKEYKKNEKKRKQEEYETNIDQQRHLANAKLKEDRIKIAEWYLAQMNNRVYYSSKTKQLVKDAGKFMERLSGYKEYDDYIKRYQALKAQCENLPKPPTVPKVARGGSDTQPSEAEYEEPDYSDYEYGDSDDSDGSVED